MLVFSIIGDVVVISTAALLPGATGGDVVFNSTAEGDHTCHAVVAGHATQP